MIGKPRLLSKRLVILFAVALSLMIILAGSLYTRHEANALRREKENDLHDVAELKANQLSQWKNERISDAIVISGRKHFIRRIQPWMKGDVNNLKTNDIVEDLALPQSEYGYEGMYLADPQGRLLFATGDILEEFGEHTINRIRETVAEGKVTNTDFYYCLEGDKIHYDVIAPLVNDSGELFAVLVLRVNPDIYLYPLIQSWPSKSKTSETLIVRRDGDSVLFLNELRHMKHTSLKLKIPVTNFNNPAAQAVNGKEGIVQGQDYRGEEVLAYLIKIPDTPWYLIAKIDLDEVYEPVRAKTIAIILFIALSIMLVVLGMSFLYRNRQANIYRSLWQNQEEFITILKNIGDGVIACDIKARVRYLNPVAEMLTGWKHSQANGKDIREVFRIINEDSRLSVDSPVDKVLSEGLVVGLANHTVLITKDSREIPIADSGAPIKDDKGAIVGAVLVFRDQTEERKIQREMMQSEEKFSVAFNSSSYAITITRPFDGKIIEVNDEFYKITGYTREETIGYSTIDLQLWVNESDRSFVVNELMEGRMVDSREFEFRRKSGELMTGLFSAGMITIHNETYILSSINDISSRKQSEIIQGMQYRIAHSLVSARTLNEFYETVGSELSTLLDTRNIFIAFYKEDTGMLYSPFEHDEKGEDPQSWPVEKSLTGMVITEKRALLFSKEEITNLAHEGKINLYGARAEQWLGVPLQIEGKVTGAIVLQSYDNPAAYSQTSVEILEIIASQLSLYIERKKAEETTIKLSKAVTQSPEAVVITDIRGNIEYVNPKFTELTGYSQEEAMGQNPRILKSGKHTASFYKSLWETVLSGKEWSGELLNKKKNGELYWESASISPILNEEGHITHFVAIKEDITEKKKMISDLIDARDKAEAANRLKTAFLNNISHEIRTPLNGIVGFSDLIVKENTSGEEKASYMNLLKASSDRLLNTINDYMDISLLTSGSMVVNKKVFGIKNMMLQLQDQFLSKCRSKNLEFVMHLPEYDQWTLYSDEELVRKAMIHLTDNAVKFTQKGVVSIGYQVTPGSFELFVKDTGPGIKKGMREMIFELFIQTDTSTTRGYEGSGLGLSIVRGIAELIGGRIVLESEEGKGTLIKLVLSREDLQEKAEEPDHIKLPLQDKKRVLIVEDEPSNSLYLETVLNRAGIQTICAENGQEAVEMCRNHEDIALVFMDMKMPLMDGFRATRMIKNIRPDLPVIAITAYAMSGDESRARDAGCDDYLAKPVKKEVLFRKLEEYKVLENDK